MGLLGWIKEKAKKAGNWIEEKAEKAKEWVVDKYEKAKEIGKAVKKSVNETIEGWKRPKKSTDWTGGRSTSGGGTSSGGSGTSSGGGGTSTSGGGTSTSGYKPTTDIYVINMINRRTAIIDSYQESVKSEAVAFENMARRAYLKTYTDMLTTLGEVMEIRAINSFIDKKSKTFKNQMRDEVNSKITIGNRRLIMLMDDTTIGDSEYNRRIQEYADSVFQKAKDNLLLTLQQLITETNQYISTNAKKFLQDEQEVLKGLKDNMFNLSKEGETKEKELEKISSEYSTLLLIKELAEQKVD